MEPSLHRKASPSQPAMPPLRPEQGVLPAQALVAARISSNVGAIRRIENRVTKTALHEVAGCYQPFSDRGSGLPGGLDEICATLARNRSGKLAVKRTRRETVSVAERVAGVLLSACCSGCPDRRSCWSGWWNWSRRCCECPGRHNCWSGCWTTRRCCSGYPGHRSCWRGCWNCCHR